MFNCFIELDQVDSIRFLGPLLLIIQHRLPILQLQPPQLQALSNQLITWHSFHSRQYRVQLKRLLNNKLTIHQNLINLILKRLMLIQLAQQPSQCLKRVNLVLTHQDMNLIQHFRNGLDELLDDVGVSLFIDVVEFSVGGG